jgi:hypothetical protein
MRPDGSANRALQTAYDTGPNYLDNGMHVSFSPGGQRLLFIGPGKRGVRFWIISARSGRVISKPRMPRGLLVFTDDTYPGIDWTRSGRVSITLRPLIAEALNGVGIFTGRPGASLKRYRRISRVPQTAARWGSTPLSAGIPTARSCCSSATASATGPTTPARSTRTQAPPTSTW